MPRATNAPASRERRRRRLKLAKGFRGNRSKLFRQATEAVDRAKVMAAAPNWSGLWNPVGGLIFDPGTADPKGNSAQQPGDRGGSAVDAGQRVREPGRRGPDGRGDRHGAGDRLAYGR